MHITDDVDRRKPEYNPIIDTEIDFDCPYIDFDYVEDKEDIPIPKNGVYDTLYYIDENILTVNEISEIEIAFYTSEVPNEKYRVGQRHIKGKVRSIKKNNGVESSNTGFSLSFDTSSIFNGKISNVTIDEQYVEVTQTKCINIIWRNELGKISRTLTIPIDDWFSPKVYLNTSLVVGYPGDYPFKIGDIVEAIVYIKDPESKSDGQIKVIEKKYIGRLHEIALTKREYTIEGENGVSQDAVIYYYMIVIDISDEYSYDRITIASTVVKSMKIYDIPEEEI